MKPLYWILIITGLVVFSLGLVLLITKVFITPPASWWWFISFFLIYIVIGLIVGIIFLILKIKKKPIIQTEIDPDDAEERGKRELIYDNDNPDNFIRADRLIFKIGQSGKEKTPVLWLTGKGSETLKKIDMIINLVNPKKEISRLYNATDEKVAMAIRLIAENPEDEIKEEKVIGTDEFGRLTTTIKTIRQSVAEKKEEETKKEAEEMNAY